MRRKKPLAEIFAESRERHRKIEEKERIIKAFQRAKRKAEYYEKQKQRNKEKYRQKKEQEKRERETKITELKRLSLKAYICK